MEYDWDAMVLAREDSSSLLLSSLIEEATLSIEPSSSSSSSRTRFEMIVLSPAHSDSSTCVWREEEETNRNMNINIPFIIPLLITLLLLLLLMLSIPAVYKIYHFIVIRLPAIQRVISRKPYLLPLNTNDTIKEEVLIAKLESLADDFQCETHSLSLDEAKEALRRFTLYSESLLTALDRSLPSMTTSSDQLKSILQSIESLNRQIHLFAKDCERFGFSIHDTSDRLLYLHLSEEATQLANRFERSLQLLYNQQSTCQQRALICDLQTSLNTKDSNRMLRLHAECEAWGLTSYSAYKEASLRLDQHLHEEYSPFHLLLQHASPPLPLVRAPSFSSLRSADADSHSVVHYSPPSTAHDSEDIIKLVKASTDNPMMQLFLEMIERQKRDSLMAAWEMKRARARDKANLFVMQCRQEKAQREASFTNEKIANCFARLAFNEEIHKLRSRRDLERSIACSVDIFASISIYCGVVILRSMDHWNLPTLQATLYSFASILFSSAAHICHNSNTSTLYLMKPLTVLLPYSLPALPFFSLLNKAASSFYSHARCGLQIFGYVTIILLLLTIVRLLGLHGKPLQAVTCVAVSIFTAKVLVGAILNDPLLNAFTGIHILLCLTLYLFEDTHITWRRPSILFRPPSWRLRLLVLYIIYPASISLLLLTCRHWTLIMNYFVEVFQQSLSRLFLSIWHFYYYALTENCSTPTRFNGGVQVVILRRRNEQSTSY